MEIKYDPRNDRFYIDISGDDLDSLCTAIDLAEEHIEPKASGIENDADRLSFISDIECSITLSEAFRKALIERD